MLDLFCGRVGGAARGYQLAGWYVVGVDNVDCPDYAGDEFINGDVFEIGAELLASGRFVAAHASPVCRGRGSIAQGNMPSLAEKYPDQIPATRKLLNDAPIRAWVLENVSTKDVRPDVMLCGEMFGLGVIMHRYFEMSQMDTYQPRHRAHRGYVRGWRHGVWRDGPYVAAYGKGGGKGTAEEMRVAKGIGWSFDHLGLRDALPPAYTETVGRQMMAATRQ